jgi:hypothetical protein
VADDTRRPEDDDETPIDPPTGEGEVVGADWLMSQLDGEPTGQMDAVRHGTDDDADGGGGSGDNPVLAWWRDKLVAAESLVNPEPRPHQQVDDVDDVEYVDDVDDVEDIKDVDDVDDVEDIKDVEDVEDDAGALPEPAQFEPRRFEKPAQEPAEPEASFLPEPAFVTAPVFTPVPPSDDIDDDIDDIDDDDDDGDDGADTVTADADRGWSLSTDSAFDREPEAELEDEAETGLIPSAEPPLFKPRSARDHIVEEPEQANGAADLAEPTDADRVLPLPAFSVPAHSSDSEPESGSDDETAAEPSAESGPAYVTEDLDNFSWKLTPNDQLDPRVHRPTAGADDVDAVAAEDASTDSAADDSDDELPTRRQIRIDAEQQEPLEPVVIAPSEPEVTGPRRRTFADPESRVEPGATPGIAKPARRPLRAARPAAALASRPVVLAAIGIVALLVLGGLFFLGSQLPGLVAAPAPTATSSPTATATPSPTTPAAPVGPAALGEQMWTALGGGECLEPYSTPWAETFTVVDCEAAHAAQMVATGPVDEDPAAAYPGEEEILSQIYLWCSAPGVLDPNAASQYSDLQVQGTYPVSEEQWADGQRSYYCFVNRSSGEPLTGSVAAPQS